MAMKINQPPHEYWAFRGPIWVKYEQISFLKMLKYAFENFEVPGAVN